MEGKTIGFEARTERRLTYNYVRDPNGCFILMDVESIKQTKKQNKKQKRITLVNVYGPSSADKPDFLILFFTVLARKLNTWGTSLSLLMETGMFC